MSEVCLIDKQESAIYKIKDASIKSPNGILLDRINITIRPNKITALIGPAGTGKSLLLRALSGSPLPDGWKLRGSWKYRDIDMAGSRGRAIPASEVKWVPQQIAWSLQCNVSETPSGTRESKITWRDALSTNARVILLDEPNRASTPDEIEEMSQKLQEHARQGSAVIVTHDLGLVRKIADELFMICAGEIVAQGSAKEFFESPPSELAANFIRSGNCWPSPPPPPLPSHFHWILPNRLAGMGSPGLLNDIEEDIYSIAQAGIDLLISLTEQPISVPLLRSFGITGRHFPIPDMGIPAMGPTARLCRDIKRAITNGQKVALHCHAGLGRTGTILASVLVWMGTDPDDAIQHVRSISPGYIQTSTQKKFIHRFAETYRIPRVL